ncbi:TSUP family transporter [Pseudomonas prosekii]|uniref:Probable membrane transporter protein n=1 Tax=Pseudomonas prosekii TaxID=1148509 RepID=A0A1H1YZW4_9PSED|nr:TSUP family transporter [Pseudomonas prosekii]SDT27001.1 hypothetical protein SAMN05216222_3680 [Pseudomonas prosekii]
MDILHFQEIVGISPYIVLFLIVGATAAGFIDSICGGGGLISVPVLLLAGFSPAQAIAANKLQGTLGGLASTHYYLNKNIIEWTVLRKMTIGSVIGGAFGTLIVNFVGNGFMETALPIMLVGMAFYFAFSPSVSDVGGKAIMPISMLGASVIPCIGIYDGFFGPGAGTFYLMALVSLGGMAMTQAVAYSRVLNLFSNAISLMIFIALGKMVWAAGLAMSLGEVIGVYLGSHLVHKNGVKLVKPLVVVACIGMAIKSIYS